MWRLTDKGGEKLWSHGLSLAAMIVSLLLLVATAAVGQEKSESDEGTDKGISFPRASSAPLVVPVYPRLNRQKAQSDDSEMKILPDGADLRDSYIVMEDGSALSMADWIKGALTKNQLGADMSDFQNRLFLGQVARAMVGQSENLVNRSVVNVGPPVPFEASTLSAPMQMVHGLYRLFVPGSDGYEWNPATSGGGFDRRRATSGGGAVLFDGQFAEALGQTAGDFQETGALLNMLDAYEKDIEHE